MACFGRKLRLQLLVYTSCRPARCAKEVITLSFCNWLNGCYCCIISPYDDVKISVNIIKKCKFRHVILRFAQKWHIHNHEHIVGMRRIGFRI